MKIRSFALALLCAGVMSSAQAHTHLAKAVPADNSVLSSAPTQITLQFSEAAQLTALSVQKEGESAERKLEPLPKERAAQQSVPVAGLTPGKYTVKWRAASKDNHIVSGALHFTVKAQ